MLLSEEHEAFRAMLRDLLAREVVPHVEEWEREGAWPMRAVLQRLAYVGALGLEFAPEVGGQGADHGFTLVFGEETGRILSGGIQMALGVHTDMATPSLAVHGTDDLRDRYLRPALRGEQVAALAVTEPDAGSDVAALRTRARRDGSDWVIDGEKLYVSNGAQADWYCLLARTSDDGGHRGLTQILVPAATPGLDVGAPLDKLGLRSSDTVSLTLNGARVPLDHTIGREGHGFGQQAEVFTQERLLLAYQAVGSCSEALERTLAYVRERHVFSQRLADHQWVAYSLAELHAEIEVLRGFCHNVAGMVVSGQPVNRYATIAKLQAGRLLRRVADTCLQFHGGSGYMEGTWMARFYRDARLISIGGGPDEVMLRVLARMQRTGRDTA